MRMDTLARITKYNLIVGTVYVILSLFFWSYTKTLGIALGATLMIANFYIMVYLLKKAFGAGKIDPIPFVLYLFKVLVLFGVAFFVLYFKIVNYVFFIIGTTAILVSLILAALTGAGPQENS